MNTNDSSNEDPQLHQLLRAARPDAELPAGFQAAVWRRIEQAEIAASRSWLERVVNMLLRPQWAATGIAVVMLAGAVLGVRQSLETERAAAHTRYITSVNPFQHQP